MKYVSVAFAAVFASALFGQAPTGNITGRITDSTGAIVVGVQVEALNPAKGIVTRATTDEQGTFRLLYLEPATYNLTFTHSGFSTLQRSGVVLRSNDTLPLDVQLS